MTASDIQRLLRERHSDDVYVEECKDGATQTRDHVRLDGWAMTKSWTNNRMIGYEVKVARSDFMRDDKWQAYMPLCNELYFVCPAKLIQPEEVPDKVGLIWAGARLLTKRKAAYRQITPPSELMKYVLMCRAKIGIEEVQESPNHKQARADYYLKLLESKDFAADVGHRLGSRLAREIDKVHMENKKLKDDQVRLDAVSAEIKKAGLDPNWCHDWHVKRQAENMRKAFPDHIFQQMKRLMDDLTASMNVIKHYSEPSQNEQT